MAKQKTLTVLRRTASIIGWFIVGACVVHLFLRGQSLSFYAASAVGLGFLWVGYELKALAFHRKNTSKRWYQIGFLGIATTLLVAIKSASFIGQGARKVVREEVVNPTPPKNNIGNDDDYGRRSIDYMTDSSPWVP